MGKPNAITRAIDLLQSAPVITVDASGNVTPVDAMTTPEGQYRVIADDYARDCIASLKRADARTRLDPTKRKPRKRKAGR